jgi:urease accessory protein
MLQLVTQPVIAPDLQRPEIVLLTDRQTLAKRLWRGTAADGREFGFELDRPLRPGDTFFQTERHRYVVHQAEEAVLEISLGITPSAAAGIGWAVGNLHLELAAEATRLIGADEPALRQLLERLKVPYRPTTAVFRPGRFVRGAQTTDDLGPSHRH